MQQTAERVAGLLENLKQSNEWERTLEAQDQALYGPEPQQFILPGLELRELLFLQRHAIEKFLYDAKLRHQEMALLEEHRNRPLDKFRMERLVIEIARTYGNAIRAAADEFADLLTQTLLSRNGRKKMSEKLRMSICGEAIRFADKLNAPVFHGSWAENTQAPIFTPESAPFHEREQKLFWERMRIYRSEWASEVDRRITLRYLLAGGKETPVRTNPLYRKIALLISTKPAANDQELCREMDSQNERALSEQRTPPFPTPKFLNRSNIRLWADSFLPGKAVLTQRIHELLSKVRRIFGLRKTDPWPGSASFSPNTSKQSTN